MLHPKNNSSLQLALDDRPNPTTVAKIKESNYGQIVETFVQSPARHLLRTLSVVEAERRFEELLSIVRGIGDYVLRLATQKAQISVHAFDKLSREPFDIQSGHLRPHASMQLDDDDTSRDGCQVDLVVEPTIVAHGNENGMNYGDYKVWSKGVVWMRDAKLVESNEREPTKFPNQEARAESLNEEFRKQPASTEVVPEKNGDPMSQPSDPKGISTSVSVSATGDVDEETVNSRPSPSCHATHDPKNLKVFGVSQKPAEVLSDNEVNDDKSPINKASERVPPRAKTSKEGGTQSCQSDHISRFEDQFSHKPQRHENPPILPQPSSTKKNQRLPSEHTPPSTNADEASGGSKKRKAAEKTHEAGAAATKKTKNEVGVSDSSAGSSSVSSKMPWEEEC